MEASHGVGYGGDPERTPPNDPPQLPRLPTLGIYTGQKNQGHSQLYCHPSERFRCPTNLPTARSSASALDAGSQSFFARLRKPLRLPMPWTDLGGSRSNCYALILVVRESNLTTPRWMSSPNSIRGRGVIQPVLVRTMPDVLNT